MANKPKKQSNKLIILGLFFAVIFVLFVMIMDFLSGGNPSVNMSVVLVTIGIVVLSVGLIGFLIFQSKMNKDRCPRCKMVNDYVILRDKELSHDVKTVTKKVQKKIRDVNGQILKTTEEIRQVTVVDSESHQQRKCKNCYATWDVKIRKHLEY